nr:hypothetical protein Iba_chr14aCG12400 [Ipomoea batatas]
MPNTICSSPVFSLLHIPISLPVPNAAYGSTVELIYRWIGKAALCQCGKTSTLQALELETSLRVYTTTLIGIVSIAQPKTSWVGNDRTYKVTSPIENNGLSGEDYGRCGKNQSFQEKTRKI